MQRTITAFSLLGLVLTLAAGALSTYAVQHGGLFTPGEVSPVPILISVGQLLTFGLVLSALVASVIQTARQQQWAWLLALVITVPVGLVGWLALTFDGLLGWGVLAVLPPLCALLYSLLARGEHEPDRAHTPLTA